MLAAVCEPFAEVRVDRDLGQIRVSRMTDVFAAGKILKAITARSQCMGGMCWGISMALHEDTADDSRLGRIVNNKPGVTHTLVAYALADSMAERAERELICVQAHDIGAIADKVIWFDARAYFFSNWNEQGRPSTRVPVPVLSLKCASML